MSMAKRIAIASQVRRVTSHHVERVATTIRRAGGDDLFAIRYEFDDGSAGRFVRECDERARPTTRFEEVRI